MARIDLPSGAWVEYRDKLTTEDKWAVDGAYDVTVNADGVAVVPGNAGSLKMKAFLGRVITDWSFAAQGIPVPSQNIGGDDVIATAVSDLDDMNALEDAVAPLFEKVVKAPNRQARTANGRR